MAIALGVLSLNWNYETHVANVLYKNMSVKKPYTIRDFQRTQCMQHPVTGYDHMAFFLLNDWLFHVAPVFSHTM